MKKTLFLFAFCAVLAGICQQASALSVSTSTTWSSIPLGTGTSATINGKEYTWSTNADTGYITITGINTSLFQFDLIDTSWSLGTTKDSTREDILYVTGDHKNPTDTTGTRSWGFFAVGETQVGGNANFTANHSNNNYYGTISGAGVIEDLLTDGATSVRLQASITNGNSGTSLKSQDGETVIYNDTSLKYSDYPPDTLTINPAYVGSVYVDLQTYNVSNSSGKWSKTFNSSTAHVATAANANNDGKYKLETSNADVLSKDNIVVGGDSQLFVEGWGISDTFEISSDIYIGSTTFKDNSYDGVAVRIGNNANDDHGVKFTGKLYVIENAHIKTSSTRTVEIAGKTTDVVDGVDTGSTLTVSGQGIKFTGEVDLKGMVVNNGTSFSNKVALENMSAKGGVSFGAETNIGTLNLASGLSSSSAAVTTSGALTLGKISLDLTGYNTGIYTLVNATGDGSSISWDANAENAWSKTGLGEGLMASVGFVGENSKTLQLTIANAITTTSVTSYTLDETGTALTLNVAEAVLTEGMVVNVNLLTDDMMQAILADMKAIKGAISEDGKAMVSITLAGSVSGTINADTMNEVVFVKGDTGQNYWGEMVGNQLMYNVERIPEPASATLSLAALMMLCARRRRK